MRIFGEFQFWASRHFTMRLGVPDIVSQSGLPVKRTVES